MMFDAHIVKSDTVRQHQIRRQLGELGYHNELIDEVVSCMQTRKDVEFNIMHPHHVCTLLTESEKMATTRPCQR